MIACSLHTTPETLYFCAAKSLLSILSE